MIVDWLRRTAIIVRDPEGQPQVRSVDPGDDYLIRLATTSAALLVSGDDHLLSLATKLPIHSSAGFLELFDAQEP